MIKKVAIEPNLSPIKEFLVRKGYEVENIESNDATAKYNPNEYSAIIVTGQNINFLGIHDTATKAMVINASGLSPQEVYSKLQTIM